MTNFEMFNKVNGMSDVEVKEMYDADKASIVKFLFVEMKEELLHTDVRNLFTNEVKVVKSKAKKELSTDERIRKTCKRRLAKEARNEIAELKEKGEELTSEQEQAIRDQWSSRLEDEIAKEAKKVTA